MRRFFILLSAAFVAAVFLPEVHTASANGSERPDSTAIIRKDSVFLFRFKSRTSMFFMHFEENEDVIRRAAEMIDRNREALKRGDMYLAIHGYCSSFVTEYSNMAMARNRSNQVKSYYITNHGLKEDNYRTRNHTVPYNGDPDVVAMMQLVAVYSTPPREKIENNGFVADTVATLAPSGATGKPAESPDNVEKQTPTDLTDTTEPAGDVEGGKTLNTTAAAPSVVAEDRSASNAGNIDGAIDAHAANSSVVESVQDSISVDGKSAVSDDGRAAAATTENVAVSSATSENPPIDESVSLKSGDAEASIAGVADTASSDLSAWESGRWNIKTNIPFWALVVPNIAVEYRFADHWSVDVPIYYMSATVARNYRFRTLSVSPSVRYWLKPAMNGHFFGVHLIAGQFNIAVDKKCRYQDVDGMYGAGLDYGYALRFNNRWGMEFNIGAGYIHTRYNTYYNTKNGACFDTSRKNYFGVTRCGISLIYRIK